MRKKLRARLVRVVKNLKLQTTVVAQHKSNSVDVRKMFCNILISTSLHSDNHIPLANEIRLLYSSIKLVVPQTKCFVINLSKYGS